MDEETREEIIASFEVAMRTMGAHSYEEGMEAVASLFRFANDMLEAIRTPEKLRETLDN